MLSPEFLKALDAYAHIFQRYEKIILQWDVGARRFVQKDWRSRDLWLWYFNTIVIKGFITFGALFLVLVKSLLLKDLDISVWKLLIVTVFTFLVVYGLCMSAALVAWGRDFVFSCNRLLALEQEFIKGKLSLWFEFHWPSGSSLSFFNQNLEFKNKTIE